MLHTCSSERLHCVTAHNSRTDLSSLEYIHGTKARTAHLRKSLCYHTTQLGALALQISLCLWRGCLPQQRHILDARREVAHVLWAARGRGTLISGCGGGRVWCLCMCARAWVGAGRGKGGFLLKHKYLSVAQFSKGLQQPAHGKSQMKSKKNTLKPQNHEKVLLITLQLLLLLHHHLTM